MDSHTPSTATTPATSSTPPEGSPRPARRVRPELRFWAYFGSSAVCAILIPIVVVAVAQLTDDGPARMLLTWLIAMLMGLAVYSSTAATHAARRMR
ncbi:hypothetical protein [Nocardioides astragali]|uniref:Uncharacterized protein n=1 Tax=Nocardioides astragali TaxID=1776736 RepID=A0ABW2MXT2_9ACTN|nr:hypothetical protein [Nocardioides astragali]